MKAEITISRLQAEAILSAVGTALSVGPPPKRIRKALFNAIEKLDRVFAFGVCDCEEGGAG